jgi:hypothetical protein
MCCTFVKQITVIITVNIQINLSVKSWVNNYLLSHKPNTQQYIGKMWKEVVMD